MGACCFSATLTSSSPFFRLFTTESPSENPEARGALGTRDDSGGTEHRSYVDGPLLDRHAFSYALSKSELDKRNQIQISKKAHDLGQRIVLKVKM